MNCSRLNTFLTTQAITTIVPTTQAAKTMAPNPCLNLGRPSPDKSLRLYTNAECNTLNGKFHANGECTKKEGGSFSLNCRTLN